MRPPEQQTALLFERADAKAATKTTEHQSTTRPPKATQYERVLTALLAEDEVCGSTLYEMYIPRFGAHIHRMRKAGYVITKRPCDQHNHEGTGWLYRLEALPEGSAHGS